MVSCTVYPNSTKTYDNPVAPSINSNEPAYYPPSNRPTKRLAPTSPPVRSRSNAPIRNYSNNPPTKRLAPKKNRAAKKLAPPKRFEDEYPTPPPLPPNQPSPRKSLKPHTGSNYIPKVPSSIRGYVTKGYASQYQLAENGIRTASGQVYDMYNLTAAHANLPLMSTIVVKNLRTRRSVVVTINDRLYNSKKLIKLSYAAANNLGLLRNPSQLLEIKVL